MNHPVHYIATRRESPAFISTSIAGSCERIRSAFATWWLDCRFHRFVSRSSTRSRSKIAPGPKFRRQMTSRDQIWNELLSSETDADRFRWVIKSAQLRPPWTKRKRERKRRSLGSRGENARCEKCGNAGHGSHSRGRGARMRARISRGHNEYRARWDRSFRMLPRCPHWQSRHNPQHPCHPNC